jgi:hypothetical protein
MMSVIIMNPPWNLKTGGKTVERNTWRKFADAALKLAETVVVVAPMSARQAGKRVLVEAVRFEGVEHDGCAVVWSEDAAQDFSAFPKFDVAIDLFKDGKSIRSDDKKSATTTVAVHNWSGARFWATPSYAERCGVNEAKLMLRLKAAGNHDAEFGKGLRAMCYVVTGPDAKAFHAYTETPEGLAALIELSGGKNGGFLNPKPAVLNAAFSARHKEPK